MKTVSEVRFESKLRKAWPALLLLAANDPADDDHLLAREVASVFPRDRRGGLGCRLLSPTRRIVDKADHQHHNRWRVKFPSP